MAVEIKKEHQDWVAKALEEKWMCSQSSLAYGAKKLGYSDEEIDTLTKSASAFGWGILNGERCGAVTGAIMALGLKYGYLNKEGYAENWDKLNEVVHIFEQKFLEVYPSLICVDIIGYSYGDPDGKKAIEEGKSKVGECGRVMETALAVLDELL